MIVRVYVYNSYIALKKYTKYKSDRYFYVKKIYLRIRHVSHIYCRLANIVLQNHIKGLIKTERPINSIFYILCQSIVETGLGMYLKTSDTISTVTQIILTAI